MSHYCRAQNALNTCEWHLLYVRAYTERQHLVVVVLLGKLSASLVLDCNHLTYCELNMGYGGSRVHHLKPIGSPEWTSYGRVQVLIGCKLERKLTLLMRPVVVGKALSIYGCGDLDCLWTMATIEIWILQWALFRFPHLPKLSFLILFRVI